MEESGHILVLVSSTLYPGLGFPNSWFGGSRVGKGYALVENRSMVFQLGASHFTEYKHKSRRKKTVTPHYCMASLQHNATTGTAKNSKSFPRKRKGIHKLSKSDKRLKRLEHKIKKEGR
jgi:hypothetical protein